MRAELALWRLGAALAGGPWVIAAIFFAVAMSYVTLAYVMLHPLRLLRDFQTLLGFASLLAATLFLTLTCAPTALRRAWRERTLLRLAPGAQRMNAALTRRVVVLAVIALLPAVILRALLWSKVSTDVYATISLSDVTLKNCVLVALYLAHIVALLAVTFGPLKVPLQFAFLPISQGAMQWSSPGFFWMPLVSCTVLVIARRCWPMFEAWVGARPDWGRSAAQRKRDRTPWSIARLQKRAASVALGPEGASLRIAALLASNTRTPLTIMSGAATVLYLVLKPGFMDDLVVSWLLAAPIALLLVQLSPLPLGRIMLLPLGAQRERMGAIIARVWVRELTARMLIFSVIGLMLHALCWWLQWPAYLRSPFFASVDISTQLLWSPLAQSVGLYGLALSTCLLCSASPRMLETQASLRVGPFAAIVVLVAVGIAFKWTINQLIPWTNARNVGHITFAVVNGAMLPAFAWCVHRALRSQWRRANLAAISAAMHATSLRLQQAFAPD
jgi:hypothetical protein